MRTPREHIVPHAGHWAVRREGASQVTEVFPTQGAAITRGREIAIHEKTELVIHRRDGRIRDSDSYGNDPCPPYDMKH